MSNFLRSIVGRIREYAGDRRHAARPCVRLPVSVSLLAKANGRRPLPWLKGYTHDISADGLSVVLSAIRIGEHYLTGEDRTLAIVVELPSGQLHIQARPVRYERPEVDDSGSYLIGVRITHMSAGDRKNYMSYLNSV